MITKMNIVRISLPVSLFAFAAGVTAIQPVLASATGPATLQLAEEDLHPVTGEFMDKISSVHVSSDGSWTASLELTDFTFFTVRNAYFGSIGGSTPDFLRYDQTTVSGVFQDEFQSPAYVAPGTGELFYSTRETFAGRRYLWVDDTVIAKGGDPLPAGSPLAGNYLLDNNSPFAALGWTDDGDVIIAAEWSATSGGPLLNHGILIGANAVPVIKGGDAIVGIPETVLTDPDLGAISGFKISGDESQWIAYVDINPNVWTPQTPNNTITNQVVINGMAAKTLGGGLLQEGEAIEAAAGGQPDEIWDNGGAGGFYQTAINSDGEWWLVGSALKPVPDTDEWVLVMGSNETNGEIVLREGAIIDGVTLEGNAPRIQLNEDGDLVVWAESSSTGFEGIYVNAEPIIGTGDLVDTDGNGIADTALERIYLASLQTSDRDANGNILIAFEAKPVGGTASLFTLEVDPREFGDFNDDDLVNADDIDLISLVAIQGGSDPGVYDLDFDGDIDADDRNQHIFEEVGTILADSNLDYAVDVLDLSILATNYGGTGGWAQGDSNGDGVIDVLDLSILATNYGQSATSATPIPEPASLAILALTSLAFLRRRVG